MDDLRLCVLGPVAAALNGAPVDLRGPRQRAVLALLLMSSPSMVTVDQLLAQAWPATSAPREATLHYYVSHLRSALEPGRDRSQPPQLLVRRGPGYALLVPADAIDAVRFERLVAAGTAALSSGSPDRAEGLLTDALDLWQGPAYADLEDLPALAPEINRLTDLKLTAAEHLSTALLQLRRVGDVVARAQNLTARHPLRERGWELLAIALYLDGRQADALAALRTVRGVLADELGIDPGPGLVAVESAVLGQDAGAIEQLSPARSTWEPASSRTVTPTDLPTPLTDLIGRDDAVAAVEALVGDARLVTLTGPGGIGKTRLALAVARRQTAAAGGPWFVELAGLTDGSLLPATVSAALGIPGVADGDRLAAVLNGRAGLLVLDNCEHLIEDVADLAHTLLRRCPALHVLTTSRETLDVPGEVVWEVAPLELTGAAAELFIRRTRAVLPGWTPDAIDDAAVQRICAELDGLPLALELAAARMRLLSATQLADGLADRFATLGPGPRGLPTRQRSLEHTVDWSYRTLADREQQLFCQLAVFAAEFDLDGAAAVAAVPGPSALAPLNGLIRRSLVSVVPGSSPRRYRMLQTLRHFADTRSDQQTRDESARRHRYFTRDRTQAAARALRGPEATATLARLRRDRPEQRAALASAIAAGDDDCLLDLVGALGWFWYRSGDLAEGQRFLSSALGRQPVEPTPESLLRRARALEALGRLRYLAGDAAHAATHLAEAARLARRSGDPGLEAAATAFQAHMLTFTGPPAPALELADRAVTLARSAGSPDVLAEALMIHGMAIRSTGAGDPQLTLEDAVRTAEEAGHRWAMISSTWALMKSAVDVGDQAAALAAAARMREPLETDGDVTSWLVLVHTTAGVLAGAGHPADAARLLGAVRAHGAKVGFAPELMDPVDGPREAAAVRDALPPNDFTALLAEGGRLDREQVSALMARLLG